MSLLHHPNLTEEGRNILFSQFVDCRLQLMELRLSERRWHGCMDREALELVERMEGAWHGHGPTFIRRMRVLDTLMILGDVMHEVDRSLRPGDPKFADLIRTALAILHPDIKPSGRISGAIDVIRRGPGPRPSSRSEHKWPFLSAMIGEIGLGKIAPYTLANAWSAWRHSATDLDRASTRRFVRMLAGLDPSPAPQAASGEASRTLTGLASRSHAAAR